MGNSAHSWMAPVNKLSQYRGLSEERLAEAVGISRLTVRNLKDRSKNPTLASFNGVARALGRIPCLLMVPPDCDSEYSTVACAYKVKADGFSSWKIHFMELVDEFRRSLDPRLVLLPPPSSLEERLKALMASIVTQLCLETQMDPPDWALKKYWLKEPWFVSEIENLKPMALLESPVSFRQNNIFVLANFLDRV